MTTSCTVHCNDFNDLAVVTRGFAFEAQYLVARRCPQQGPGTAAQAAQLDRANALQCPLDVAIVGTISPRIAPLGCISRRNRAIKRDKSPLTRLLKAPVIKRWLGWPVSQITVQSGFGAHCLCVAGHLKPCVVTASHFQPRSCSKSIRPHSPVWRLARLVAGQSSAMRRNCS